MKPREWEIQEQFDPAPDHTAPTWANQLWHAEQLTTSELRRHASVSLNNQHRCSDCFCCAALTVLERRIADGHASPAERPTS